ncbi:MAG: chorismate mutase, partial [Candidatus Methanomethylophilus sp.]|nr:chorismate mutase [Methanomethylophilus sp.]
MMEPASTKVLRDEIADIDAQIIDLLATRMDITDELAKAKKASGQSAWDDDVEKRILPQSISISRILLFSRLFRRSFPSLVFRRWVSSFFLRRI